MIHKVANRISCWCECILLISEDERQVIQYGIEVFLDGIIKVLSLFLVGCLLGRAESFIIFVIAFCSLRCWAGGFHCKTSLGCFSVMLLFGLISVYGADIIQYIPFKTFGIIAAFCYSIVYLGAPGQTSRNPINNADTIKYKRKLTFLWLTLEYILMFFIQNIYLKWVLIISVFLEICSIIPCMRKSIKQRRKNHV